jgi:hypothetical protein
MRSALRILFHVGALCSCCGGALAWAQEEAERIPQGILAPPDPSSAQPPRDDRPSTIYLEAAPELIQQRKDLEVPVPPHASVKRVQRLFLDARTEWRLTDGMAAVYSGRSNAYRVDAPAEPGNNIARHDLREGYLAWRGEDGAFASAGRINVRNGVAYGFNPTDYFKTNAVVDALTRDPAVLRESRLGTFMVKGQQIFDHGALSALYAPRLTSRQSLIDAYGGLNLQLHRTNAANRFLLKGNADLDSDFSPELLLYRDDKATRIGANITRSLDNQSTLYAEWSGGRQKGLFQEAIEFGVQGGDLPGTASAISIGDTNKTFKNDLAIGWTRTNEYKVTVNVELDYHQAGFSEEDWRRWFSLGKTPPFQSAAVRSALYYARDYASLRQEPLNRRNLFLRLQWDSAFVRDLTLAGLMNINPDDRSFFAQASFDYRLSDAHRIRLLIAQNRGPPNSQYGSVLTYRSVLIAYSYYL